MSESLRDFLLNTYAPSRVNLGEETIKQMLRTVDQLDSYKDMVVQVSELSEPLLVGFQKFMSKNGISPKQIKVRRGYIMTLWRFAYKKGKCEQNPFTADVDCVRIPKTIPIAWSLEQIRDMLNYAATFSPRGLCQFGGREWTALILLLYYSGLRITATLSLKKSSLRGHYLYVPHGIQKDEEEMHIRLPDHLVNLLLSLRRPQITKHGRILSEMLIPWPWSLKDPQKRLNNQILKPAGLPDDHLLKFHAFRKTTATIVAAKSSMSAAQDVLGHSSIAVTERYIADPSTVDPTLAGKFSPMDVLPRLIG